jgi:hypothetical protein
MYAVIALVGLAVFMWVVAIWASFDDTEEDRNIEKSEESTAGHEQRKAA